MNFRPLPVGISNFADLIQKNSYYVDKTLLIREILNDSAKVTLFTRPRRFGKTLNMSMLRYFFENTATRDICSNIPTGDKTDWSELFKGLKIMDAGEKYTSQLGQYPVIYLTFKDAKKETFELSYKKMVWQIASEFGRHSSILNRIKRADQRETFKAIMEQKADQAAYETSIFFLSECLKNFSGKNPIVLIDEYDVPLENAFSCGFYQEMVNFIRSLFESGLKDNENLNFAVLTGCLRVSKESIFTGMNNLKIISINNHKYGEYFGFLPDEVKQMCRYYGITEKYKTIKDWYNGYTFGETDIYNPWSVIQYIDDAKDNPNLFAQAYWVNTSSNSIVRTMIDRADDDAKEKIERLIAGGAITIPIYEDITYNEIYDNMDNLWNFMFFTGYFRKMNEWQENNQIYAQLKIPNREVSYIFEEKVRNWFRDKIKNRDMTPLYTAFLEKNCTALENEINDIFDETISYMDQNEYYYHGMIAGLFTGIKGFCIRSDREGGKGRSDLFIKPIRKSREAFIIEFKVAKSPNALEEMAAEAICQIEEKKYASELKNDGYIKISCYGIAFCGKECGVQVRPWEPAE